MSRFFIGADERNIYFLAGTEIQVPDGCYEYENISDSESLEIQNSTVKSCLVYCEVGLCCSFKNIPGCLRIFVRNANILE